MSKVIEFSPILNSNLSVRHSYYRCHSSFQGACVNTASGIQRSKELAAWASQSWITIAFLLLFCRACFPSIHRELATDSALELKRLFQSDQSVGLRVLEFIGISYVDERVVLNRCRVAFRRAEQWAGLTNALNQVVSNKNGCEVASTIESKQPIIARRYGRPRDDVIVADHDVVEHLVDPDQSSSRIANQVIVKAQGPRSGRISKARDEIAVILFWDEIKQVVVNLNSVAGEFD